jgi:undecaprenyl-diphosphatase
MNWIEALILGILQGLTEFLPVSSSGHLELGKALFGIEAENSLAFTVAVHGATVLSTIVVFRNDLYTILRDLFRFRMNESTIYTFKILFSMIPVLILGLFFKEEVESLFTGNVVLVGAMLLVTAALLGSTYLRHRNSRSITFVDAFIIGIAQALAVMPGISRSGATISTGLLLGNKRESVTRFSFLMVLIPIIGANLKDIAGGEMVNEGSIGIVPLVVGFLAAFISGLFACRVMIGIVRRGNLVWFAVYCLIIGLIAIFAG